jgi:putative NIF3 family GTP cyclohydrolase 1 type 2
MNPARFSITRRTFVQNITVAAGTMLLSPPLMSFGSDNSTNKTWTVGEVMDLFLSEITGAPFPNTVDTLKAGSRENEVRGIVTTMFATIPVIHQAIKLGANFIIAHEPTFYSHLDETDWLQDNEVYQHKAKLLDQHRISVWRNHDYIHSHKPDGVYSGVLDELGWKEFTKEDAPWNVTLPPTRLYDLIKQLKSKLRINSLRYIGDNDQLCRKILLMPGAAGGRRQITAINEQKPDVAIVGELQEWETAEYIRDARASGKKISLVVLGHTDSEDGGSIFMRDWLKQRIPELTTTHVHSGNPFRFA